MWYYTCIGYAGPDAAKTDNVLILARRSLAACECVMISNAFYHAKRYVSELDV